MPVEGKSSGGSLGEADDEGETDALGLRDGLALLDGLMLGDGDGEALSLLLGETLADGESDGLTLGEPTDATERISTTPATLGEVALMVNEPELTVATASND